jgi:hypothetical protein
MLFVSGEKAERFPKAMVAGADVVCIDLEDAVHIERKQVAREQVLGWLSKKQASEGPAIALRINGLRTLEGLRDVLALDESGVHLDWLLVPKVEDAAELRALHSWIGHRYDRLTVLIETPRGVENALSIAHASGRLTALMLGGADLAAELGAQFGWDGLLHARGRLVNAAKAAGLQAWDVPHIDLGGLTISAKKPAKFWHLASAAKPRSTRSRSQSFTRHSRHRPMSWHGPKHCCRRYRMGQPKAHLFLKDAWSMRQCYAKHGASSSCWIVWGKSSTRRWFMT